VCQGTRRCGCVLSAWVPDRTTGPICVLTDSLSLLLYSAFLVSPTYWRVEEGRSDEGRVYYYDHFTPVTHACTHLTHTQPWSHLCMLSEEIHTQRLNLYTKSAKEIFFTLFSNTDRKNLFQSTKKYSQVESLTSTINAKLKTSCEVHTIYLLGNTCNIHTYMDWICLDPSTLNKAHLYPTWPRTTLGRRGIVYLHCQMDQMTFT